MFFVRIENNGRPKARSKDHIEHAQGDRKQINISENLNYIVLENLKQRL